jgi:hypothetical protein
MTGARLAKALALRRFGPSPQMAPKLISNLQGWGKIYVLRTPYYLVLSNTTSRLLRIRRTCARYKVFRTPYFIDREKRVINDLATLALTGIEHCIVSEFQFSGNYGVLRNYFRVVRIPRNDREYPVRVTARTDTGTEPIVLRSTK